MAYAKTGRSLPVPNVQVLAQTLNGSSGKQVPERFVRTEEVCAEEVVSGCALPVVDLGRLLDPRSSEEELANLGFACQKWGFFQLINHGVPDEVIQDAKRDIAEFFELPLEAKKVYAQLPESGLQGYGQAFVVSETQKLDWCDRFFLILRPTESRDMKFWPAQPPSFRSSVDRYSAEAAKVVSCLLRFMAAEMGLEEPERLLEVFEGLPQNMRATYYPPCVEAGKVIGLSPHSDACGMTLLLHVNDVQGLQISKDGKWVAVEPMEGALVVNIGDVLEILSNGRYTSVEHRATVHESRERISAALFQQVCPDTMLAPLPELVNGSNRARYRSVSHEDFMKQYFSTKLDGRRSHLDHYKI
ncbi:hypothetical protein PR202_ga23102 [Eleusine coracana subsp. coracana]|uniref:Fe2OG dioxygenase domain-containing protein n=1 Tax=Eleusine coracana subsp. coracana TaxID=191504 RepID=A0AAV5D4Y9_ELECO|nr:hypothetical protein QOZ80_1AG0014000 [Eleusine coracana subsp. coracana]GJN05476.1 hypothetical protein PR202_ga23102 [Eleusine coracana subsp. coracana]